METASFSERRSRVPALISAAVVAATMTAALVTTVASIEAFQSQGSTGEWIANFISAITFTTLLAIPLGFIGAALFLAPAFAIAGKLSRQPVAFPLAGAMAGMAHATAGTTLHSVDQQVVTNTGLSEAFGWLNLLGGFPLTGSLDPTISVSVFPSAVAAGAVAGLIYVRLTGIAASSEP